jgi:hypothetical protein
MNATSPFLLDSKTFLDTILHPPNPIHAIFMETLLSLTLCMLLNVFKICLLKSDMISPVAVDNVIKLGGVGHCFAWHVRVPSFCNLFIFIISMNMT